MADYYTYKNRAGHWCARKRLKTGDVHFNSKTTDRRTYEKRAREWYEGLVAEQFGETPKPRFIDAVDKFCVGHLAPLKAKTVERYKGVLFAMIDDWADLPLDKIGPAQLAEWETKRRAKVKPQTIGFEFKVLSSMFEYCNLIELHEGNPVLSYLKKKGKKADIKARIHRKRYLSHEEEHRILSTAPQRWRWRIMFAVESGLRKEEQFSLEKRDVDTRRGFITVRAEIAKNGKERRVPLTDRARKAVKEMHDMTSIYVCPKDDATRVAQDSAYVNQCLQEIAAAAGIPATRMRRSDGKMFVDLRWHDLRRTCGVRLLRDRRMSMEDVQLWLGHEDIQVTQDSYAFLDEEELQERVAETERRARAKRLRGANGGMTHSVPPRTLFEYQDDNDDYE